MNPKPLEGITVHHIAPNCQGTCTNIKRAYAEICVQMSNNLPENQIGACFPSLGTTLANLFVIYRNPYVSMDRNGRTASDPEILSFVPCFAINRQTTFHPLVVYDRSMNCSPLTNRQKLFSCPLKDASIRHLPLKTLIHPRIKYIKSPWIPLYIPMKLPCWIPTVHPWHLSHCSPWRNPVAPKRSCAWSSGPCGAA